ncbi:HYR domain-containing protein [Aequorivita lipolytica]|uniref:receptor protein-tyrosine kinase n=1 Tax=Aequorivita lipolytica TaxID=153267 RepID=A0A5C6YTN2_9FLAO|nr:HYR domain-containing protein [Aequorivita lipolytica]TXD70766.1 HYR domain-containing protein [Aequorivita lipolytica]SRX49809.1 hypothetical protein AEQU2_00274 [Aequorivita lipolytica]
MKKILHTLVVLILAMVVLPLQAQTYTFTNAGASGSNGPTQGQVNAAYTATTLDGQVTINTQGIQEWTVPSSGEYRIQVIGSTGGNQNETTVSVGHPADISGDFTLTAGETLKILVGQHGHLGSTRPGWGGGGGSYITQADNTPLAVAGGCGSGHTSLTNQGLTEQNANTGTSGKNGSAGTGTWPDGFGATGGQGGDGAGLLGNGTVGNNQVSTPPPGITVHTVPQAFINNGAGDEVGGGFGGGGGVTNTYGGGGGGYSGGQGAVSFPFFGGGGASYNNGVNQINILSSNDEFTMSHGQVIITLLNAPPVITCPGDITVSNDPGICGAVVNYTVTATDAEDGVLTPTQTAGLPSGSEFPVGTTTNTFEATDSDGNTVTCSFDVTVNDTEAPVITCPGDITQDNDPGICGAEVTYTIPTATDNCGSTSSNILFVSDNGDASEIETALTSEGYTVTAVYNDFSGGDNATLQGSLSSYELIYWHASGANGSGETHNSSTFTNLDAFVANGGNVFVTGYDVIVSPVDINLITFLGGTSSNDVGPSNGTLIGPNSITAGFADTTGMSLIAPNGDQDNLNGLAPTVTVVLPGSAPGGAEWGINDVPGGEIAWVSSGQFAGSPFPAWTTLGSGYHEALLNFAFNSSSPTINVVQTAGLASGETFPIGTTTNTFEATDASGNTTTCSFDVTINDNEAPVFADIYGDGTLSNPFTSILPEIVGSVPTGTYYFSYNGNTFQGALDNDTDGGGWLMILNYVHQAGDNSNLQVRNTDLPLLGASILGTSEAASPSWGHFGNALAADIDFAEVRFYGQTSRDPNNIIDFTTDYSAVLDYVKTGNGSFSGINNPSNYTLGASHNASIPQNAPDFFSNEGDFALTNFPFWRAGQAHWGIRGLGNRWEVDDFENNNFSTIHRVWVKGDLSPSASIESTSITVQLDASGNVTISAADFGLTPTDNCGVVTQTLSMTDFDCSNVGSNTIQLTGTDAVGNETIIDVIVNVEDNVPPVANCAAPFTIQLDANGDASITVADIENGSTDACGIASTTIDITDFTCADVGPNTVTLTVTDVNGNTSTCTAVVTVEDNVAPVANCAVPFTVQLDANGDASITVADIENGSTDACGIASTSIDIDTFDCSNVGANTVTLTVTDVNGNTSTCTTTVTVEDGIAPTVICPADITANTDAGNCFATVSFSMPIALDNCGVDTVVQTAGLPSGSQFPVGVNTIEFTATDVNGNTSTCSFTITVVDNEAPLAVCQNITIQLDANGNASIVAGDVDGGSTDQCGVASIAIDVNTFDCSNVGDNNVVLTVTDVNGNTSTCTAIVTVEDITAPVVACQDITVELDPVTGTVTIAGTDIDNGSTDACGIASYDLDIDTFDCSNIGDNMVVLTVTDVNGNTETCTAIVTVEDNTSPVLVCQDFTIEIGADGTATLDPSDVIASNDDACGIFTVAVDITEFSCADIGTPVTVQIFSQDNNGNLATCTAVVTVVDNLAPVVSCPADQTVDPGAGNLFYIVPDYFATGQATAVDNCTDPVTITSQDPAVGTALPDGTYTITLTATDEYGNTGSCSFELTVDTILGAGDNNQNLGSIAMYPNPAKGYVNIGNPQSLELESADIYDLTGRLVQSFNLKGMATAKTLNVDNLAAATYVVIIKGKNGQITKRLLKE